MPGQAGILEDISETYIYNITELPYSPGIPEKRIQTSGHISGWVDIVGFRQLVRDNGIDYIPGKPEGYAIVQSNARSDFSSGDCNPLLSIFCFQDKIDISQSVSSSSNQTVATLSITLKWHKNYVRCGGMACWWETKNYTESATFEDREVSPLQFIFPTRQEIIIEKYRGVVPKEIIKFKDMDEGIIAYRITTGNGSVTHRRKVGRIETTPKGIFFMNLTLLSVWEKTGSGIYHWRDDPIMGDDEIIDITFDTAYGRVTNIDYRSGMVYHENKETTIQPGVWSVIYLVLIFFAGIYIMYKSSGFK